MDRLGGVGLDYLGWSGFRLAAPGGGTILLDPPAGAAIGGSAPLTLLLTHGHPEHVAGSLDYLRWDGDGTSATVLASPAVCRHLERRARRRGVAFRPVRPGERVRLGGGDSVDVFGWRHLPLLPPGLSAKVGHVARLASRPGLAARIALAGVAGPPAGEMLGFRLDLGGQLVVAYGEGLHRRCPAAEAAMHCCRPSGALLLLVLLAVEPEDQECLPELLLAAGAGTAVLYEPHARWRAAFGMPRADLPGLRRALEAVGIRATIAEPEGSGAGRLRRPCASTSPSR
jgi:hypothetical protein